MSDLVTEHAQVDPEQVLRALNANAQNLDHFTKHLATAVNNLDEAEDRWEEVWDQTAEELKDEMAEEGRKGDPAEHTIKSVARRQHREVYRRYRTAKRQVDKFQRLIAGTSNALSGRQTLNNALKDELKASGGPQPSGHVHGGQRAA